MNNMKANIVIDVEHDTEKNVDIINCKVNGSKILILEGVCELLVEMEEVDSDPAGFRTLFLKLLNEARTEGKTW